MRRITPAITIRKTDRGRGVFAARRYRRGEIVGDVCGTVVVDNAAARHGSRYCMELGEGRTLEPEPPFCYVNHSCDPNCEIFYDEAFSENGPPDRLWLRTLRAIENGDELTIDYAWPAEWAIPCRCGSANCRGWIVVADEMAPTTQKPDGERQRGEEKSGEAIKQPRASLE